MEKFFVVWNQRGGSPTFKHENLKGAKDEAERLCRENPGHVFFVLESPGCFENVPVVRPAWNPSFEMPF